MQFSVGGKVVSLDRIYECINAMHGISKPEAFMRDVRKLENELEIIEGGKVVSCVHDIIKHLKGGK